MNSSVDWVVESDFELVKLGSSISQPTFQLIEPDLLRIIFRDLMIVFILFLVLFIKVCQTFVSIFFVFVERVFERFKRIVIEKQLSLCLSFPDISFDVVWLEFKSLLRIF